MTPDKRFEVDGANATRTFSKNEGWDAERIQLVWDAIALHATPEIALHSRPFIGLVSASIATELFSPEVTLPMMGPYHVAATIEEWRTVSEEFPRKGLKVHLRDTLMDLCLKKPEGTYGNFVGDFGHNYLEDDQYSQVGRRFVDLIESETRD